MRTTIQLSDDLRQRLKLLVAQRNTTYEDLIEELIEIYDQVIEFKSEREFSQWFEQNFNLFGFKEIISKNKGTPDYYVKDFNGKTKKVELELCAQDFIQHRHKKEDVDIIVALFSKDEKSVEGIPTLVLNTFHSRPHKNTATFVCDEDLWKEFRKIAIDERKTASELLEEIIKKELRKKK
jgi:predicted DNA-binding ribbon-helix-helix protein